ncbi:hypothetical protein ACQV2E_04380 [Pantoea allii]|uniref:hypothetical protein n=1 Tax=Pantoea allii TaxID=574096 RepID=UPI003D31C9CB
MAFSQTKPQVLKEKVNALIAFAWRQQKSFTRAAAILRLSPSALSHIRQREERLLSPTTRPVAPMRAGERRLKRPGFATECDNNAPR